MNRRDFFQNAVAAGLAAAAPRLPAVRGAFPDTAPAAGPAVRTVLGPVSPEQIGVTLMHEHAPTVDWSELYETPAAPLGARRDEILAATAGRLKAFQAVLPEADPPGAIVECTPIRVGRFPDALVELARMVPVHIVACTGFWCEAMAPQHPWAVRLGLEENGVERLADLYIREIRDGMEDPAGSWGERFTDVKCGIIKVATSTWLRPSERRCHEAAALACLETGCPITTHTTDGGGLEQAGLFQSLGVPPDKVIIGHQGHQDDRSNDEADLLHLQLADLGCNVQFDRVGHAKYSVEKVARQMHRLVAAGHTARILAGHDHVPFVYKDYTLSEKPVAGWEAREADFTVVPQQLAEALRALSVPESAIRAILVDNPRRVLAF
jgi:phosphotriesterase-related protein